MNSAVLVPTFMNGATTITTAHQQESTASISLSSEDHTAMLDQWAFLFTLMIIALLSACHFYYIISSRMVPSTDEAHYMSGVLSIAQGIRTGSLSVPWNGYQNALGFKPPLICLPAALLMLIMGGLTLPCMLSLVLTFVALGFASYSLFRYCLRPFHAAIATALLVSMPMITGLTHRFYVELLLILLCVLYLDLLLRQPWSSFSSSLLAGIVLGLGVLCKTTFPALVGLPTLYSFWLARRENSRTAIRMAYNVAFAGVTAFVIAWPWYAKNWKATLDHAKLAASIPICYYPHWIQADISVGAWIVVFCAAAIGLPLVIIRLVKLRDTESERSAWIMILLLGLVTALMAGITINKATRFTAT